MISLTVLLSSMVNTFLLIFEILFLLKQQPYCKIPIFENAVNFPETTFP